MNFVALYRWNSGEVLENLGGKADRVVCINWGDPLGGTDKFASMIADYFDVEITHLFREKNDCYPNYRHDFAAQAIVWVAEYARKHKDAVVYTGATKDQIRDIKSKWQAPWSIPRILPKGSV